MTYIVSTENVRTPRGLVPASELSVGDRVFDSNGKESEILLVESGYSLPVVSSDAGTLVPEGSVIDVGISPSNSATFNPHSERDNYHEDTDPEFNTMAINAMASSTYDPPVGSSVRGAVEAIKKLGLDIKTTHNALVVSGIYEEAAVEGVMGTYFAMDQNMSSIMSNPVGKMQEYLPRDALGYAAVMSASGQPPVIDEDAESWLTSAGGILIGDRDKPRSVISRLGGLSGASSRATGFLIASGADITEERLSFITGVVPTAISLLLDSHTEADWEVQWTDRPPLAVLTGSNPGYGAWEDWLPDVSAFLSGILMSGANHSFEPHENCVDLIDAIPGLTMNDEGRAELNSDYVSNMRIPAVAPGSLSMHKEYSSVGFVGSATVADYWPGMYALPGNSAQANNLAVEMFNTAGSSAWGLLPAEPWLGSIHDVKPIAVGESKVTLTPSPAFFDDDPEYNFFDLSERVGRDIGRNYFEDKDIDQKVIDAFLGGYSAEVSNIPVGDEFAVTISGGSYTTEFTERGNDDVTFVKTRENSGVSVGFEGIPVL